MTQPRVRSSRSSRPSAAGWLSVVVPAAILAGLAPMRVAGQAPSLIAIADQTIVEGNGGTQGMAFTVTLSNASQQEVRANYITLAGAATGGVLSTTFTGPGPIVLPDVGPAATYPNVITVSGVAEPAEEILLSINSLTHPSPGDLDLMLEAPDGRRMIVQSDAGGAAPVANLTYAFHDTGPALSTGPLAAGTVRPTSLSPADAFPAPAPPGPNPEAAPAGVATLESAYRGIDPNGPWKLWILDDTPSGAGTLGSWHLNVGVRDATKDYVTRAGQVVFPPGTTTQQIVVTVNGDTVVEPNEAFRVVLLAPVNAGIADDQADGTILSDDGGNRPTGVEDAYSYDAGGILDVSAADGVLKNDIGAVAVVVVDRPADGVLTFRDDGGFTYRPPSGSRVQRFTYRAINAAGVSDVTVVTLTPNLSSPSPPPANFRIIDVTAPPGIIGAGVTVRFDPPANASPTGYAIAGGALPGQTLATLPTDSTDPIYRFDAPFGSFSLRAHAQYGSQVSPPSNEVPLHATTAVAPSAPENLLVSADGSAVTLAWRNTFRGGIPTNSLLRVSGAASLTVPLGTANTFSYPAVPAGTYGFEVINTNAGGQSVPSNTVTETFPRTCSGPPQTPTDFLLYATGLFLSAIWELPTSGAAPDGYLLDVTSPVFTGRVPFRTTNFRNIPVAPGAYTVSVIATTACGASAPTPAQTVVVR